jgi:hypothetical protein
MSPAPQRRWFQFSLRTLFVVLTFVAVLAGGLAWELHLAQGRRAALQWIEDRGGEVIYKTSTREMPLRRRLTNNPEITFIIMGASFTESDKRRIGALFPEAEINPEENGWMMFKAP